MFVAIAEAAGLEPPKAAPAGRVPAPDRPLTLEESLASLERTVRSQANTLDAIRIAVIVIAVIMVTFFLALFVFGIQIRPVP